MLFRAVQQECRGLANYLTYLPLSILQLYQELTIPNIHIPGSPIIPHPGYRVQISRHTHFLKQILRSVAWPTGMRHVSRLISTKARQVSHAHHVSPVGEGIDDLEDMFLLSLIVTFLMA